MAGDWIKIEHALPDKPEVMIMAAMLKIDSDSVVGKLIRIWTWFDNHTDDGVTDVTLRALLDRYAGVTDFVAAMEQVGWITLEDGRLSISHFDRHNGKTAKDRANTNRRVAKSRKCNGQIVTNVTTPPLQKPLPEKRREENSKDIDTPCTETEAWQFAKSLHQLPPWTEQAVTKWYSTRASSHWTKGGVNQFPITSKTWKEDLRSSHSWATQQTAPQYGNNRNKNQKPASQTGGNPHAKTGEPDGWSINDTALNLSDPIFDALRARPRADEGHG